MDASDSPLHQLFVSVYSIGGHEQGKNKLKDKLHDT